MSYAEGWAIVLVPEEQLCFTSSDLPYVAKGKLWGRKASVWQIYTNEADAKAFCKLRFSDAQYKIVKVQISEVTNAEAIKAEAS